MLRHKGALGETLWRAAADLAAWVPSIALVHHFFVPFIMPSTDALKPLLRADLIVTQAEIDGEATYTVRDDVTGESFRMYAVEYAIAQRLNGERDVPGIIAAVQQDLQLPVTQEQLMSFLRELDARGLISGFAEGAAAGAQPKATAEPPNLTQTATLNMATARGPTPLDDAETVASPGDAVTAGAFALVTQELVLHERGSQALAKAGLTEEISVDPKEVQQLLRDALFRMVDDDVGGAVSILNAAHSLAPKDERVSALAEATQTAYAHGTKEAAQVLRERGASLFPELMPDALARSTTRPEAHPAGAAQAQTPPAQTAPGAVRPKRGRALWAGAAVAAVALVGAALWARLGPHGAVAVTSQTSALVPHELRVSPAQAVSGEPLAALGFVAGGVVAQLPAVGAKVAADELIASLKLPAPIRQHLLVQSQRLHGAELYIKRLQRQRDQLVAERKRLMARPGPDKRPGAEGRLRRALQRVAKQERQVRGALVTAQSRRAQAEEDYRARTEAARPLQLYAPRAGVVAALKSAVGQTVAPKAPVVELVDGERLTLAFLLPPQVDAPPAGAQLTVLAGKSGRRALQGRVLAALAPAPSTQAVSGTEVRLAVAGPDLPLGPEHYQLLAMSAPKALQVPAGAVVPASAAAAAHLWQLEEGHLRRLPVTVLDGSGDTLWVAPKEPPRGAAVAFVVAATVGGKKVPPKELTAGAAARPM